MNGIDKINVYKMTLENTPLFGNIDKIIAVMGLPEKVMIEQKEYEIKTIDDLNNLVLQSKKEKFEINAIFNGTEMFIRHDKRTMPIFFDFRKINESIVYGNTIFNTAYTMEQFAEQFPQSFSFGKDGLIEGIESLFKIKTKETGSQYRHFMLYRRSKDNIFATPMVEFTFENERLICIFFANW
ncbi:hypothetical protein FACS1894172_21630 [Spirochaetia bacterium]|nr:hypothetical protein FACS1894172_21630 [Spirochaetia bacterium]